MKYLMMIYGNAETWAKVPPEQWPEVAAKVDAYTREYFESGEMLGGYGLGDAPTARVVRTRDGAPIVTDGPYLETKEHMASAYLLDVGSEERALEIAAAHPYAAVESVEIWPITNESHP